MPVWFGKYRLIKAFAQGGMAEIFLAKQVGPSGFSKTVVLKRVLPHLAENQELVTMFLDEARLAANLAHPNIVQIFDFGELDGAYYLAMEYLAGEDLGVVLRAARKKKEYIPVQIACQILAGACAGLHYAHTFVDESGQALNVVHRDVSPSNIMITYQGVVKVLDFGIAKAEGKALQTKTGILKGKYPYMSPEQVSAAPLDGRSDVFALGSVFYEVLTGRRLFARDNDLATLKALLEDTIAPPEQHRSDIPPEVSRIVMKALQRDLSARYPSAAEMRKDIVKALSLPVLGTDGEGLAEFLRLLVGEKRIEERSRVPDESSPSLDSIPGLKMTPTPSVVSGGPAATAVSTSGPLDLPDGPPPRLAPREMDSLIVDVADVGNLRPRKFGLLSKLLGALAAFGALAGGGYLAVAQFAGIPGTTTPSQAVVTPPAVEPAVEAAPSEPVVDEVAEIQVEAAPTKTTRRPRKPKTGWTRRTKRAPKPLQGKDPVVVKEPEGEQTFGTLDVNCIPWCKIYVDGRDTGVNSPARGLKLKSGRRKLRVLNPPTGKVIERYVRIEADKNSREAFRF